MVSVTGRRSSAYQARAGLVVDTKLEPGAPIVKFGNGMVVCEPIVGVSDEMRRVAWFAISDRLTHYNGSAEVVAGDGVSRVIWTADFLPDEAADFIDSMMGQGMQVIKETLDRLSAR